MIKFTKKQKKTSAIVGTGLVIGLAGIKLLRSEEAKKVYQKVAAVGLTITTRVIDKAQSLKKDEKPKE